MRRDQGNDREGAQAHAGHRGRARRGHGRAQARRVGLRLRLVERLGSAVGFSPEGREVRVWVQGMPGADETQVVSATITEVRGGEAVLCLGESHGRELWVLVVPHEPGWGLQALWFSFIAVDAFELETGEGLGRWFIRLGLPPIGDEIRDDREPP